MKVFLLASIGLLLLSGPSLRAQTQPQTPDDDKTMWRLTVEADNHRLDYGSNNAEDTPIAFNCKPGTGSVDVWINETGKGVRANRKMTASLTAGRTVTKVPGKTLPNEEAGTPSFSGSISAKDPIFAALSKEKALVFVVGPSKDQVPLEGIDDKAEKFRQACQKK